MDRCHRIGQAKPVKVYVLVAADTVDETIYKRAAGKKEKSESLLDKGDGEEDEGAGLDGSGRRCVAFGPGVIVCLCGCLCLIECPTTVADGFVDWWAG